MQARLSLTLSVLAAGLLLAITGLPGTTGQDPDRGQAGPSVADDASTHELLPIDESMFAIAAATGGDFYFWSPGEFARSELRIPVGGEDVLLASGVLRASGLDASFEVDATTGRLEVFVGAQRLTAARVVNPYGLVLAEPQTGVDLQRYERMRIATVERPVPGTWRVELAGDGRYSCSVRSAAGDPLPVQGQALEHLELFGFDFVELRGRPGHEGWFPIERDLVAGAPQHFELELSGSLESVEVVLVDLAGGLLDEAAVAKIDRSGDASWATVRGTCVVPEVPFRVRVQGQDVTGARYQRVWGPSIQPTRED